MSTPKDKHWIKVASFPKASELSDLKTFLDYNNIAFEFTEEGDLICIWVGSEKDAEILVRYLNRTTPVNVLSALSGAEKPSFRGIFKLVPVTLSAIVICITLFALEYFRFEFVTELTIFIPFQYLAKTNDWWRLFTPALMHGGIFHLLFNMLWAWELGARIEHYIGRVNCLIIILVSGIFSNVVEYFVSETIYFRGYSGVVYAYLGFLWVFGNAKNDKILQIPIGLYYFMFIWLGLGVFGLVDIFMPGDAKVANGAHVGGLIAGLALGKLFLTLEERRSKA